MSKKYNINRWVFQIPLEDVQEDNEKIRMGKNPCLLCGKEIKKEKYFVHLLTSGNLVSSDQDFEETQGFHPVGNCCRKKLPNNFVFGMEQ